VSVQGLEPGPGAARAEIAVRLPRLLREVNRRLVARSGVGVAPVACECADRGCAAAFEVPLQVFRVCDARSDLFLVSPGHEQPGGERVVRRELAYVVVERRDSA
jgi:hypothetical protein